MGRRHSRLFDAFSPMSSDRKANETSPVSSMFSKENELNVSEMPVDELKKTLITTKKQLLEAESNVREMKVIIIDTIIIIIIIKVILIIIYIRIESKPIGKYRNKGCS